MNDGGGSINKTAVFIHLTILVYYVITTCIFCYMLSRELAWKSIYFLGLLNWQRFGLRPEVNIAESELFTGRGNNNQIYNSVVGCPRGWWPGDFFNIRILDRQKDLHDHAAGRAACTTGCSSLSCQSSAKFPDPVSLDDDGRCELTPPWRVR
jgi:hypothetical protein